MQTALLNVLLLWILTAPHEFAHAWVATRLGDDTPRLEGRVTLYPLAHVDWIGTAILPFVMSLLGAGFLGWGKPVRTDTNQAARRAERAGPGLACGSGQQCDHGGHSGRDRGGARSHAAPHFAEFAAHGVWLSLYLAIINMLPIPPLDGSKLLLAARVPMRVYQELARFGFMLLIVVISLTSLGRWMSRVELPRRARHLFRSDPRVVNL